MKKQTSEGIAKPHSSPNPRFLRRIRFFANRLWPTGYADLQKIEPALKSSNLGREASFAIPSLFILFFIFSPLHAKDETYLDMVRGIKEKIKKEGFPAPNFELQGTADWTDEQLDALVEEGEQRARRNEWTDEEQKFVNAAKTTRGKVEFQGDEAEFHPEILKNPLQALGIVSEKTIAREQEVILKTCEESGSYEREFTQTLEVTLVPELKKIKKCKGHHHHEEIKGDGDKKGKDDKKRAKKVKSRIAQLKGCYIADPAISGFTVTDEVHKYHTDITARFEHIDDSGVCTDYYEMEISGTKVEKDEWKIDAPEEYASFKNNPNCKLSVYVKKDPKSHTVDGKEIFRDIWEKGLLFECAPGRDSPCAKLREEGGVLIKSQCLRQNEETGKCEFWSRTFDLGKARAAHTEYQFEKGKEIWGLNWKDIDPDSLEYDKSSDFYKVFGPLKALSDMPYEKGSESSLFHLDGQTKIFNGTKHECSCNHIMDELYDCCEKIAAIWPAKCDEEEWELHQMREEGRCHKVGHYKHTFLGDTISKTWAYCCFPTKLLRIFNEEARKQMKIGWGTPKKPDCRGFSLEQMDGKIDASAMFSDSIVMDKANDLEAQFKFDEDAVKKELAEKLRAALADPLLQNLFHEAPSAAK